jgi:Zn-finger nucleic acid-binding protein
MKCVKCDGRLVTVRVDDIDVDQCDRCGGLWFDAHELERVLRLRHLGRILGRAHDRLRAAVDDARLGHCPRCGGEGHLVRLARPKASFHVDTCAVCGGKWLDGGEIDVLATTTLGDRVRRLLSWVLDLDLP